MDFITQAVISGAISATFVCGGIACGGFLLFKLILRTKQVKTVLSTLIPEDIEKKPKPEFKLPEKGQ